MTTQTSFSEKKPRTQNRRFFNSRFFKFQLKTGWPLFIVFVFVFILSMGVPAVNYITKETNYYNNSDTAAKAVNFLYELGIVNVVISMFGGLLCGLTAMKYTTNKVAVNFYHSLPVRREALFVTSTLHSFVYYISAYATGLLLVFVTFSMRLGYALEYIRPILLTFEYGVLFFFLIYAMTLFASSLTGTGFMRIVGTGYVLFLPVAIYTLFIAATGASGIYHSIINIDYYISMKYMILLFPPFRFINLVGQTDPYNVTFTGAFGTDIAIVLITAVVFYGLAFLLYCLRASESTSQPVIWKPASFVFKYASIFMGGTLFALMFYGMFESVAWMVFGVVIGSVILFMLTNGIISKSARAIFKGLGGFAAFMAFMAVVTAVFYCDVFGIFAAVPDGSFVKSAEISINNRIKAEYGGDFACKVTNLLDKTVEKSKKNEEQYYGIVYDKDTAKPLVEIYSENEIGEDIDITDGNAYSGYVYKYLCVEAVLHTKIGVPYAVKFYPDCDSAYELVKYIYDTGKADTDIPAPEQIDDGYIELNFTDFADEDHTSYDSNPGADKLVKLIGMLSDPFGIKAESPAVGMITLYEKTGEVDLVDIMYMPSLILTREYVIHANDVEVLNEIMEDFDGSFESEYHVIDYFIDTSGLREICVVDNDKNERITLNAEDTLREFVKTLYSFPYYHGDIPLCENEHRYNVFLVFDSDTDYYSECLHFRRGTVPDRVTELFGK